MEEIAIRSQVWIAAWRDEDSEIQEMLLGVNHTPEGAMARCQENWNDSGEPTALSWSPALKAEVSEDQWYEVWAEEVGD